MNPEQHLGPLYSNLDEVSKEENADASKQAEFDPYQEAMRVYEIVVEFLKKTGHLHRPSEIRNEYELDNHFDDLASVFKRTILLLDLDWPPPIHDIPLVDNEG